MSSRGASPVTATSSTPVPWPRPCCAARPCAGCSARRRPAVLVPRQIARRAAEAEHRAGRALGHPADPGQAGGALRLVGALGRNAGQQLEVLAARDRELVRLAAELG